MQLIRKFIGICFNWFFIMWNIFLIFSTVWKMYADPSRPSSPNKKFIWSKFPPNSLQSNRFVVSTYCECFAMIICTIHWVWFSHLFSDILIHLLFEDLQKSQPVVTSTKRTCWCMTLKVLWCAPYLNGSLDCAYGSVRVFILVVMAILLPPLPHIIHPCGHFGGYNSFF